MVGSFRSAFGIILSLFYVFAPPPIFLSSFQLLVNNELFHQSSFYLKNIVLSVQLLFKKSYLHFSPGGKCPGGKCCRTTTHRRSQHSMDTEPEFHTEAPQATVSEG